MYGYQSTAMERIKNTQSADVRVLRITFTKAVKNTIIVENIKPMKKAAVSRRRKLLFAKYEAVVNVINTRSIIT
jgi:hypothetical protein